MRSFLRQFVLLATLLAAAALAIRGARAASPQLNYILPPGATRGTEQVFTFTGDRLDDAEEALFYTQGVTAKKIEPVDAKSVRVTVDVAPDCRLGQHIAQLRTRSGISDYRPFFVGALPAVEVKEPNDTPDAAQPLQPNVCVAGVLPQEDVDCFRVHAAKGERLSVEVEGMRLGQAFFDPYLALLDAAGNEIAACDDTLLARQDSFLSIVAPEDGEYIVLLRESSYRGNANCRYRLHVGSFPRPTVAFPAGGKRGETVKVQWLGDPTGPIQRDVAVAEDADADGSLIVEDERGITPSAIPFRAFDHGNVIETEPNDAFDTATSAELPRAFNGRLETDGDMDYFKFAAKKGEVWNVECYAQRIGSPLDAVMHVFSAEKKTLAGSDDSRKQDSYLRWQVPADGEYYLRIKDHLHHFGPECVYRVEMTPATPALKVAIPRADRYSQTRQTIVVPRGNRYGTLILATRADVAGPVEILGGNLPAGMSLAASPMHPSLNRMPVVFEAADDAPLDGHLIDFRAAIKNQGPPPVEGGFQNVADFVRGEPNNAVYVAGTVEKLAVAVADKVPYRLEIVEPKVPLVRRGTMNLKILIHRDEGFDKPLQLRFPFVPPGVGAAGTVSVPQGASEAVYPLNANDKAMLGKWPVMAIGAADVGGQAWVSSQLAQLEVAEPYVDFAMKRAACDRGRPALIHCTLTHNAAFKGAAKATLLGLPPGVSAEPREFTQETTELVFEVKTTDKTPLGKHKTLLCQTSIEEHGEPIVATVGSTELQVNAQSTDEPAAATPPKPLSRLEQLRAKYASRDPAQ